MSTETMVGPEGQKPDRKDLKIQALINKVTKVENENADYQVELHVVTEMAQQLQNENAELRQQLSVWEQSAQTAQESVKALDVEEEVELTSTE